MPFTDLEEFLLENLGFKTPFIEERLDKKLEEKRARSEQFFAEMKQWRRQNPQRYAEYHRRYRARRNLEDPAWRIHTAEVKRAAYYRRIGRPIPPKQEKHKKRKRQRPRKKWKKWRTHKPKSAIVGSAADSEVK